VDVGHFLSENAIQLFSAGNEIDCDLPEKQCIVKIWSTTFDELIEEFRHVHRDMEWKGMDFGSSKFLDRTMYLSWGLPRGICSSELILATFEDPRPLFAAFDAAYEARTEDRKEPVKFESYLYAFKITRKPIGLTTFALTAEHYFFGSWRGSFTLRDGKYHRKGFKMIQPPLFSEVGYGLPRDQIISGTVRQLLAGSVLPSPQSHGAGFYREIRKKEKHLERLAVPLRRKLADLLMPHLFPACHIMIADYFLGA